MREILFRGKTDCANQQWTYGYYRKEIYDDCALDIISDGIYSGMFDDDAEVAEYVVIPETVGQYTGLTDKNGVKIFEGDIVEVNHDAYPGARGDVFFKNGSFMLKKVSDVLSLYGFLPWCEVIGNIHDNPELLGENT